MFNCFSNKKLTTSDRLYKLLLVVYPAGFRRKYGQEMAQVFRDCHRQQMREGGKQGVVRLWVRVVLDLIRTAPEEYLQSLGKGGMVMKALQKLSLAILVYAIVILTVGRFLSKWKPHIPYILGSALDSLVSFGIAFNFIALLLVSTKLLNTARAIRAACVAIVALLVIFLAVVPGEARPDGIAVTTWVLSLLFWFGVHSIWARKRTPVPFASSVALPFLDEHKMDTEKLYTEEKNRSSERNQSKR